MVGNRNVTIDRRFWGVLGTVFILFIFWKGSISQSASMHETVLLTGGLGFIGSHLVDELLVRGYTVVIFDDKSTGHNFNPEAITIIGDITKVNDFDLIKYKVDYIVHFAAAISVAESMVDPAKYERINVEGSRNVFEWGANHNVKKIVSASSASVYGVPEVLPLSEDAPTAPISKYASSKLAMEQLQKDCYDNYKVDNIALRFFNVYGPRQNPKSTYSGVISKFIEQASNNKPLTILGDGTNTRDFVYVKDIAKAIILAIKNGVGFKIYNVGTSTEITITQIAETIIAICHSSSIIEYKDPRPGDIKSSLSDTSRIKKEIGWHPTVSLREGLKETISWYKSTQ